MRAWVWAAGSFIAYVLAFFLAFFVAAVAVAMPMSSISHPASLALWAAAWVLLSGMAALVGGRRLLRIDLRTFAPAWIILAAGAALNAFFVIALVDWATQRLGYWEPDLVGDTLLLWAVIPGLATAGFGMIIAPRNVAAPPALCVVVGAVLSAAVVASDLPGGLDGIRPESWPLALVMGAVLAYAIGLAVLSVRKVLAEPRIATNGGEGYP